MSQRTQHERKKPDAAPVQPSLLTAQAPALASPLPGPAPREQLAPAAETEKSAPEATMGHQFSRLAVMQAPGGGAPPAPPAGDSPPDEVRGLEGEAKQA